MVVVLLVVFLRVVGIDEVGVGLEVAD